MPGSVNVRIRFTISSGPMPVLNGSMPRDRMAMNVAAIRPKTAPEAPTVNWFGSSTSTSSEPPSSDIT
jgi:hypothetical protein